MELFRRHPWLPFVVPLLVYMLSGIWEPAPYADADALPASEGAVEVREGDPDEGGSWISIPSRYYPLYYAGRIALTVAAIVPFVGVYRSFPLRISVWSVVIGAAGAAAWIGLCRLGWEAALLRPLGLESWLATGARAGFDPFASLGESPWRLAAFLAVRFLGLVCVVPFAEELFLRAFLMRYVVDPDWWTVPIGRVTAVAVAVGTMYGVVTHPGEAFAAAVWFSLITWLVWKTGSLWDAVVAHAVTNLLLGIYIVTYAHWSLW